MLWEEACALTASTGQAHSSLIPAAPTPLPSPARLHSQMGMKITNEAPVGIKAGLRASYAWVTQEMLDAVNR